MNAGRMMNIDTYQEVVVVVLVVVIVVVVVFVAVVAAYTRKPSGQGIVCSWFMILISLVIYE